MKSKILSLSIRNCLIASAILVTGCESLGPQTKIKVPINTEINDKSSKNDEKVVFKQLKNQDDEKKITKPKVEQYKGSGRFIDSKGGDTPNSGRGEGKYSLNFDEADLGEVSKIILSDMLGENYVLNPTVAGKVTLQTTRPLAKEELLPTLEMLLRMNDVALVKSDGIYRIEPNTKALQASQTSTVGKMRSLVPGFQTKIVPLSYVSATDMSEILTPLLPDKAVVRTDPARNILMVSGSQYEIERILDIIKTFDVNYMAGLSFGLYPLENVDVAETITQLEQIFSKEDKTPLSGMIKFVPVKHLNAVLVASQQPEYLEQAKMWVERLDKPSTTAAEGGVVVYRVQHVDAVELASTLMAIFTGSSTPKSSQPSITPGSQTSTLTNKPKENTQQTQQVNKRSNLNANNANNPDNELAGVNVIADEANNALVITAKPQQYKLVKKIVQELDVMPLQVMIDATVLAVKLTDKLSYGIRYLFENHDSGADYFGRGGFNTTSAIASAALAATTGGFSYGFLTPGGDTRFVINMLASKSEVSVLSSPSMMVLNNHEAKFHVGDTVPYQTGTSLQTGVTAGTNLAGTSGLLSQNQQVKTGVDLEVKPRVNANGIVIMDITQKVDNVKDTGSATQSLTPTILQREIKSSVAVVSGETVILGGLISEDNSDTKGGIPLLKDIPWLGNLFSDTAKNKTKDELVILITPKVVENKYDARKVAAEFKQRLPGIFYEKNLREDNNFSAPK